MSVHNETIQSIEAGFDGASTLRAPSVGDRRAYGQPYQSLTFPLITRGRRELSVTLATQPVFDLERSTPVSRRVRRRIRHQGGEGMLGLGRRSLDAVDLKRIDLQTLRHGLDLLRAGPGESGVLPAFWRTVESNGGRFALLCEDLQREAAPDSLLIEVIGGLEHAPAEAIEAAISHFETATLGVILHIAPDAAGARRLGKVRAQCLAIDFAGVEQEGARHWQTASALIGAAREACPQVLLLNLRPDRGLAARAAGATHAVFAGMDPVTV